MKTIDLNKDYRTRGGNIVRLLGLSRNVDFPIVGEICDGGDWKLEQWTQYGKYICEEDVLADYDLIDASEQKPIFVSLGRVEASISADKSVLLEDKSSGYSISLTEKQIEQLVNAWDEIS